MAPIRLIALAAGSGPWNMAVDEAIAEGVAAGTAPPTLRLYTWRGAWLSIGLAQPIGDVDHAACARLGVGILRRASGGTAVLHEDQIAWSLALPPDHPLAPPDIVASYFRHAQIALETCDRLGIAAQTIDREAARASVPCSMLALACFGSLAPHEIVVGSPPRKLIGWGQVRRRGVVLHHAVASLHFSAVRLAGLLVGDPERLASALSTRVTDLAGAAGRDLRVAEVADAIVAAHIQTGLDLVAGALSADERRRARRLVADRYGREDWTARR